MADWLPGPDDEFHTFMTETFGPYLAGNGAGMGLNAGKLTRLANALNRWGYAWTGLQNAEAAVTSAVTEKTELRDEVEAASRDLAQDVQRSSTITNVQRDAMGVPVRDTTRTPVAVPSTAPTITKMERSAPCVLRLFFADGETPDSRAKPDGVSHIEIREQIGGTEPTNLNAMQLLGTGTRPPFRANFEMADWAKPFISLRAG
ncbi:MAG TPA: hypothetical protein VGF13_01200 [Verrucomicrobiae bacterium]|jgi:hypothetical protein